MSAATMTRPPLAVHVARDRAQIADVAVGARVLEERRERIRRARRLGRTGDDLDAERRGARAHDVERLREHVVGDEEACGTVLLPTRNASAIASAAAVPSSSIDALAIAMPVRSHTIVWKLTSASRRPCEISGWYGVYAVYQAGFSRTLRRMTGGVIVP